MNPVALELPRFSGTTDGAASQAIELRMVPLGPDTLDVRVELHPTTVVYLSADLLAELPRLDALDGDTYFIVGFEFRLTRAVEVFVEDFQPASLVVGDPKELLLEPPPLRSWDGHQISLGARWRPSAGVSLEAAAVFHVLSATRRSPSVGAMVSWKLEF